MKLQALVLILSLWLCYGCDSEKDLTSLSNDDINLLLSHFDAEDPVFVNKEVQFDSILTIAGIRSIDDESERIKSKLFFFGEHTRGYFNLADSDTKNLQVFGKKIGDLWVLKSVTKLNMEESDGYIILDKNYDGIWSNGNINFRKGSIALKKQNIDYTELNTW